MSHIQKRMDNPTCSPFPSPANPNLFAITTLPRNSQRLTDRFFVREKGRNLSGFEEPDTCSMAVRDKGDHFLPIAGRTVAGAHSMQPGPIAETSRPSSKGAFLHPQTSHPQLASTCHGRGSST
jgi:hypothetical protein